MTTQILEQELVEINSHNCPARIEDTELNCWGCIYDGRTCTKQTREDCSVYLENYQWRRIE